MDIDKANIDNLVRLWGKYGAKKICEWPIVHANTHWPHRCWFALNTLSPENKLPIESNSNTAWLINMPESGIFSVLPMEDVNRQKVIEKLFIKNNYQCCFQQTAMYMPLDEVVENDTVSHDGFEMIVVNDINQINQWVDIGNEAFGYKIDPTVIEPLINDKDIRLFLGYLNAQPVASALLFKTDEVIGIHQVGVRHDCQNKGIGRSLIQSLIPVCTSWQAKHIVLQASEIGQSLYKRLGFKEQFIINYYQKES